MRVLRRKLLESTPALLRGYPALMIAGPRQSGKTTLARLISPDLPYVNFESPIERADFDRDPVGFLSRFPGGAILDEIQHVPDALAYLQVRIDEEPAMGGWVLTGSQQVVLSRQSAQSLAGRVAMLELLPFSHGELTEGGVAPTSLTEAVFRGGYPPLYDADRDLAPSRWLEDYLATFVNRDVRSIIDVRNRTAFDRFLRLCAGRTGQLLNTAELARDVGADNKTIAAWISVLEACYVIRLLRPHHRNFGKRLVKSPKLYFLDSGLACRLLHVSDVNQLRTHPLWGALVETWCVGEALKGRLNRALPPDLWFWRSSDKHEVDLLLDLGSELLPIEIKAGESPRFEQTKGLRKFRELSRRDEAATLIPGSVIYGGSEIRPSGEDRFVPWTQIDDIIGSVS